LHVIAEIDPAFVIFAITITKLLPFPTCVPDGVLNEIEFPVWEIKEVIAAPLKLLPETVAVAQFVPVGNVIVTSFETPFAAIFALFALAVDCVKV